MVRYELEEKTLDVEGLCIAYTDIGPKDGHLVFCVHGLLSTGRDFDYLGRALAKRGYRCISIDLPGRGKSGRFNHYMQYVPLNYLPYCLAVLEHEASGQEFCWLGVSLGGILGMMLHKALAGGETSLGQKIIETITTPINQLIPRGFFMTGRSAASAGAPVSLFTQFRKTVEETEPAEVSEDDETAPFDMASLPNVSAKMTRLILIDIGAEIPAFGLKLVAEIAHAPTVFDTLEEGYQWLKKRCVAWGIRTSDIWEHLIKHNLIEREDGKYEMHYDEGIGKVQPKEFETVPLWHLWNEIKQPVFLVRGGKSRLLPEDVVERMHQSYKGERFSEIVYADCGHIPNVMEEAHVNALVTWIEASQR